MAFLPNKVTYRIPVFDGGLNTKWTDLSAPAHMSPSLLQVAYSDVGAATLARGYRKLNDTRIESFPVDGLHSFYDSVNQEGKLVAVCNGTVYAAASGSSAFSPATGGTSVFTQGKDVCARTVEDEAWMTNGYESARRYDGSEVYLVNPGLTSGTASALASFGVGSMSIGTYSYKMSGEDADGREGNAATITTGIVILSAAVKNEVELTDIPVYPASAGVVTKYLYRNTAGVSNLWYRVTALTANQTTYLDQASDSVLSTSEVTDNDAPPLCKWWWYHRGRMFGAGDVTYPMRLYYSKAGHPHAWPALNYLEIGKGDGMPITSVRVMGNSVIVHKGTPDGRTVALYVVYMPDSEGSTTSSNWYVFKSPAAYAAMGDKGVAEFENMMAFLDRGGLYAFNGEQISGSPSTAQAGQYMAQSRSDNIEPDVSQWKSSLLSKAAMTAYDDSLWLAVPGSPTSLQNDALYVYDYSVSTKQRGDGAWSKLNPLGINNFSVHNGTLVGGSATDGYVYELDTGYSADGANLDSYFYTMTMAGEEKHWDLTKVWRYLWLTVDSPGAWNLDVKWWVDKAATETGSDTISLTSTGTEWDVGTWDSGTWDSGTDRKTVRINLAGCVGRTIQFKFGNSGVDTPWSIYRLEVEYNLRSRRY